MRGRPRKPTAKLKLERGAIYESEYPGRGNEPNPDGVPPKPSWLSKAGEEFWTLEIQSLIDLGVLTRQDRCICWMACKEYQRYMAGRTKADQTNGFRNLMRILPLLGLTPADRSRVVAKQPSSKLTIVGARERA